MTSDIRVSNHSLMTSAVVKVFDNKNKIILGRLLLDTCATANFVTESFAKLLNRPKVKSQITIEALNNMVTNANWYINLTFKSIHNEYTKSLNFFVVPTITDFVPSEAIPIEDLEIPKNINLADPTFYKPAKIDMLIGSGPTLGLFSVGQINISSSSSDCHLQKTKLGWIIGGQLSIDRSNKVSSLMSDLKFDLTKFWSLEELSKNYISAPEENDCERHFIQHIRRDENGRYVVALPFKINPNGLGDSKTAAMKQLRSLKRRLAADPKLGNEYSTRFQEHITLGHMSLIKEPSDHGGCHLSHHPIVKASSSTTKTRIVLDGSMPTSTGLSLNDCLMVGPTIQDDLFTLLLRFRTYRYVVLADIEKMYLQFLVRDEDRDFQKVLWFDGDKIVEYKLNVLIFGLASSPFLAIRCLHQLVHDEGNNFPIASKILKNDMYVDNMITDTNSLKEAREIYVQVTALLKKASLNMRQWASNNARILHGVNSNNLDDKFKLDEDCALKTLGMYWKAKRDIFIYDIKTPSLNKVTMRIILSEIAKIFDPLGLLGPVGLYAKKIMQDLWQAKVTWDESIPSDIWYRWVIFCEQLESLNNISINRWIFGVNCKEIQMHGFCDASEIGYGACVYIRSKNELGT